MQTFINVALPSFVNFQTIYIFDWEDRTMNEFERNEYSNDSDEKGIRKISDGPVDYCDVCFIAFGSQEKRICLGENVVHPDCANKAKSKKAF